MSNHREVTKEDLEGVPRAHRFEVYQCGDPNCGPHFIAFDVDDNIICEMVVARRGVPPLVDHLTLNFTDRRIQ